MVRVTALLSEVRSVDPWPPPRNHMGHSGQKMFGPLSFILLTLGIVLCKIPKKHDYVLATPGLSLVPITGFPSCLTNPLYLVPDPEDCHIFYQCDLNPHPMSCGDMMFNSHRQVQYHSVYRAILNIPAPIVLSKVHTKVVAHSFRCATGHLQCSN